MDIPTFKNAYDNGTIVEKSGYHKPKTSRFLANCGCSLTTDKGTYRDFTIEMDNGLIVHYYHQTPVVAKQNGKVWVNNGSYETSSTKERINRYIPSGYYVRQKDFTWYLEKPNGDTEKFKNKTIINE